MLLVSVLLTSSLRLLTSRTPLEPVCPARATLPAAAAAAAAALRGFRAPDGKQTITEWKIINDVDDGDNTSWEEHSTTLSNPARLTTQNCFFVPYTKTFSTVWYTGCTLSLFSKNDHSNCNKCSNAAQTHWVVFLFLLGIYHMRGEWCYPLKIISK